MPSLSTPIGDLESEYGVVVVGSGYGGAIAAYRMAAHAQRSGGTLPRYSVCVLERGSEREAGDFPSTLSGALLDTQADTRAGRVGSRTALFDFRMNHDISVLVGCGLGGTSLINAAVMLEPTDAVLEDERWPPRLCDPRRFRRAFRIVKRILDVSSCPPEVDLDKVTWLRSGVAPAKVKPAPVAISFQTKVNQFNVQQQRCILCGSCITGCNHSAKNTVAANYLPGAANAGAAIFSGVETRAIEKGPDGTWLVHVRLNDKTLRPFGNPEIVIRARMVFLAAGTLGSTEILLRSRDQYGLPVSDAVGRHFSGNGDVIAFGYNTPEPVNGFGYGQVVPPNAAVGPTIAAMADERTDPEATGAMIQEGAIPGALRFPLRFGAPVMARATNLLADTSFDAGFRHIWREIDSAIRGVRHGALARTQTFLAMGLDDGHGRMRMDDDRLRIIWEHVGYQKLYRTVSRRLQHITAAMKGRYVINPFWSRVFGRRLVTVHPLGGCAIGSSAAAAVVNAKGEVFDSSDPSGQETHSGLYVCDGSIIPMALGTNPSLTISALAEHICRPARSSPLLKGAPAPTRKPHRIVRWIPGVKYAERLRGTLWLRNPKTGAEEHTRIEATLRISAESVEELIGSEDHTAYVIGVVRTPDLDIDRRRWTVSDGRLHVLIDDPRAVDTKLLVYRLTLTARDGGKIWLRGHKTVNLATLRRHPWRALTRVPFVVYKSDPSEPKRRAVAPVCRAVEDWDNTGRWTDRAIVGAGMLQSNVIDAIRLATSMKVVRERNLWKRLRWRWRFTWRFFLKTVIQQRVWAIRTTRSINPFDVGELKGLHLATKRLGKIVRDKEAKGRPPRFEVTQYRGFSHEPITRGPVMVAPGFGMSTLAFYAAGRDSFAQYLRDQGYDVWLFDYRASDKLEASLLQFDIDQLAQKDFPDAIRQVHELTGERVRVVAHCLSSMTMQMGLLSGKIDTDLVRSMVLSQSFAFIDLPWPTRVKVRLHLPELLKYLNFSPVVTSDFDRQSDFGTRLLDRLLYFFPSKERCYEGVCRRLLLLYGEVVCHDNLEQKTHETFYQLFDRGNLSAFRHIGRMFILGRIADKDGKNHYLRPENAARVTIPLTLLQGTRNNMFLPSGAYKTHRWFVDHGGFDRPTNEERFTLVTSPGYGHLDSFLGRNAKRDVFPQIAAALERMDALN